MRYSKSSSPKAKIRTTKIKTNSFLCESCIQETVLVSIINGGYFCGPCAERMVKVAKQREYDAEFEEVQPTEKLSEDSITD